MANKSSSPITLQEGNEIAKEQLQLDVQPDSLPADSEAKMNEASELKKMIEPKNDWRLAELVLQQHYQSPLFFSRGK
jgi:hypothetical protein